MFEGFGGAAAHFQRFAWQLAQAKAAKGKPHFAADVEGRWLWYEPWLEEVRKYSEGRSPALLEGFLQKVSPDGLQGEAKRPSPEVRKRRLRRFSPSRRVGHEIGGFDRAEARN